MDLNRSEPSTMYSSTTALRRCQGRHTVRRLPLDPRSTTLCRMKQTPPPPPALHELEAEVMDAVWNRGEASVRQVMDAVNAAAAKPRAYTTYMTILGRLHTKGLLARRREGKTDIYRAVYTREEYADLRAQADVAALIDAYGDVALGHFARQVADLDPERRRALQRIARER